MGSIENPIRLDLNNPIFQEHLFDLQKPERNAAIDTLRKIRLLTSRSLNLLMRQSPYAKLGAGAFFK